MPNPESGTNRHLGPPCIRGLLSAQSALCNQPPPHPSTTSNLVCVGKMGASPGSDAAQVNHDPRSGRHGPWHAARRGTARGEAAVLGVILSCLSHLLVTRWSSSWRLHTYVYVCVGCVNPVDQKSGGGWLAGCMYECRSARIMPGLEDGCHVR